MSSTTENRTNSTSTGHIGAANNCINIPDYFRSSTNIEEDKRVSRLLTMKIYNDFSDVFTGIGCFEGTLKLQVKEGSLPPRRMAYALQEPL